jgi:hypothetical protein
MTIPARFTRRLLLALLTATIAALAPAAVAWAAAPPVKEILSSHIGWEVDTVTKGNVCTVTSGHPCQPARSSSQPGGFERARSVAGAPAPSSNVYVADRGNSRVQELTAAGAFVAMFGWDVNKTKTEKGAPQPERNVCTAASGDTCQAGVEGTAPGQFGGPESIAVDPVSGDFYVAEEIESENGKRIPFRFRVQKFTAEGKWVLELGKEVNETKDKQPTATVAEKNLCTEEEVEKAGVKCTGPAAGAGGPPGAFQFPAGRGDQLAVGGPEDLLYVGGTTVQEFEADGKFKGEIPGTGAASIAVDQVGEVFLAYQEGSETIREFDQAGKEIKAFPFTVRDPSEKGVAVGGIAFDGAGRLAVSEFEAGKVLKLRGSLYEVAAGGLHLITEFAGLFSSSLAFNSSEALFAAGNFSESGQNRGEVLAYAPVLVGELVTGAVSCAPAGESEMDVTLACGLHGVVNPEGVSETEVFFQWGATRALGSLTPKQAVGEGSSPVAVGAEAQGVRPNEPFFYQLAGEDHTVKAPELLSGVELSFTTPSVPPRTVGVPGVSFVHASSAVLFGEVNPENAGTRYEFQYVPEEQYFGSEACARFEASCPGLGQTVPQESASYGVIATTQEATGLQPATVYRYRLFATNEKGQPAVNEHGEPGLAEGSFQTAPAPAPQALTGAAGPVGTTSAVVSGTVNPDGAPATYAFELGVYNGAGTQFGIVSSGPVPTGTVPVGESLALTGLQPGTAYAYRITVSSGFVKTESRTVYGETRTFTTAGLPEVLAAPATLAQLAIPAIAFPATTGAPTVKSSANAQKLAQVLRACNKKRSRKQRAACQKRARSRRSTTSRHANNTKKAG